MYNGHFLVRAVSIQRLNKYLAGMPYKQQLSLFLSFRAQDSQSLLQVINKMGLFLPGVLLSVPVRVTVLKKVFKKSVAVVSSRWGIQNLGWFL